MLKRLAKVVVFVLFVVSASYASLPARADAGVVCPPGQVVAAGGLCMITVTVPGEPAVPAPGGGQPPAPDTGGVVEGCEESASGRPIPCQTAGGAYWSKDHQCYVSLVDPQPDKSDPIWEGRTEGAIYRCHPLIPIPVDQKFWSLNPPAGPAIQVNPAVVAQTIVEQMNLRAITIGMAPEDRPDSIGLVGLPVWMWVAQPGPDTFGPLTRSASAGAVTVTATAKVNQIVWDMGDGNTVTCTTAGTPYLEQYGAQMSPDCGHRYVRQGVYPVTATSYWVVAWTATTGQSGSIPLQFSQSRQVQIGELQVTNGNR